MRPHPPKPSLESKVAFLSDPKSYPDAPRRVKRIETHFAWVFLAGSSAYKLKKPLRHGRIDYRTRADRRRGCLAELDLNRRLAPAVYEAVLPLSSDASGRLTIGEGARIEDYLVKMRRLPLEQMLDRMLAHGTVSPARLGRVVRLLARFFRDAKRHPFRDDRYLARIRRQVLADRRTLRRLKDPICDALVGRVAAAQLAFIASEPAELAARGRCVVEGHGDLRAEHVFLGRPCCIIDCLEFDRDLRLLDPIAEIAQLALEIARRGSARIAHSLLAQFRRCTDRYPSEAIVQFYMSLAALTRAKLAANHVGDPQFPDPRPWIARARLHLREALEHAQAALCERPRTALERDRAPSLRRGRRTEQQLGHRLPLQHSSDRGAK